MQVHFKDDLDWKEYRPIGFIFQSLGYLMKTVTRKWLFSLSFLAEVDGERMMSRPLRIALIFYFCAFSNTPGRYPRKAA